MSDMENPLYAHIENNRDLNVEAVGFLMRYNFLHQGMIPNTVTAEEAEADETGQTIESEAHPLQVAMVELATESDFLLRKSVLVNDGVGFPQFDFVTKDPDYDSMRDRAVALSGSMEELAKEFDIQNVSSLFFLKEEAFAEAEAAGEAVEAAVDSSEEE